MAQRRELRLDGRGGAPLLLHLDLRGDVKRLHGFDRSHVVIVAPRQKLRHGAAVGAPRVQVANVRREEFEEAERSAIAGGGDQRRQNVRRVRSTCGFRAIDDGGELIHDFRRGHTAGSDRGRTISSCSRSFICSKRLAVRGLLE
jgi:hypothetical protein